jgi:NO-binding membrane sensor protein with MHYT domain
VIVDLVFNNVAYVVNPQNNARQWDAGLLIAYSIANLENIRTSCNTTGSAPSGSPINACTLVTSTAANQRLLLNSLIRLQRFVGATGLVDLDANGNNPGSYEFMNQWRTGPWAPTGITVQNTTNLRSVGIIDVNGTISLSRASIFSGNTEVVPLDRAGVRIGEKVTNTPSPSLYVLAYGVAVVGCWVSLILVEQAVALRVRYTTLGVLVWLAISSFAATIAVWASTIIGITAIRLPDLPAEDNVITFDAVLNTLSLIPSWALMFLAFWCTIHGVHSRASAKLTMKTAPGEGSTTATAIGAQNQNKYSDQAKVSSGVPSGVSLSGDNRPKESTKSKCIKFWSKITDRWLVIGTFFLVASVVVTNAMSSVSVRLPCSATWIPGIIIVAYVVCGLSGYLALLLLFHLRATQFRSIGAFVFAVSLASFHIIMNSGIEYQYNAMAPAAAVDGTTLQLVGAVVTAVISFILIGLNVTKLKLSRDILDAYLLATQKKARNLEMIIQRRDDQLEEQGILFKLIHVMRPITRKNHFILQGLLSAAEAHQSLYGNEQEKVMATNTGSTTAIAGASRTSFNPSVPRSPMAQTGSPLAAASNNHTTSLSGSTTAGASAIAVLNAAGASVPPSATFEQLNKDAMAIVMDNIVTLEIFKDAVNVSRNNESLAFWIDVQTYKQTKTTEERRLAANDIVSMFLEDNAPHSVNISGVLRASILKRVRECKDVHSLSVFDAAEMEVRRLIQSNDWSRFIGSDSCDACLLVLKATRHLKQKKLGMLLNPLGSENDVGTGDGSSARHTMKGMTQGGGGQHGGDEVSDVVTIGDDSKDKNLGIYSSHGGSGMVATHSTVNLNLPGQPHHTIDSGLLNGGDGISSSNSNIGLSSTPSGNNGTSSPNSMMRGRALLATGGMGTPKSSRAIASSSPQPSLSSPSPIPNPNVV